MSDNRSTIRADVHMKFYTRFLLLGIAGIAAAGWFFRDGLIKYPHQREVWDAYIGFNPDAASDNHHGEEGHADDSHVPEDFPQKEWDALVIEKGWQNSVKRNVAEDGEAPSFGKPEGKHWSDWKIKEQLYIGAICTPIGLLFLLKIFLARGMWIESNGESLTSSWGKGFRYADVTQINKKKWQDKGLAYVKHTTDGGGTFIIDDLKFNREATDAILYELEQAVGVDKIVGGRPENDPNAKPKPDEAATEGADESDSAGEPAPAS